MSSLFENIKDKVIAAKQHLKKGTCSHLKIIFTNHIPTNAHKSFLLVKIRNVPLDPVLPLQKEPTITEIQEELPKENIPVPNLEENPKENAENLANLDTIMIYTEEVTKKNDKTDDKLKSLYIQEEKEFKNLWTDTINKLKVTLNNLALRNLSFKEKILVANSLVLSRIWYIAYILPPNKKQIAEINGLITLWIKGNSRMLLKYSTYQQSYEQGGLQAPIISNLLDARALIVWLKLLSGNTFWAKTSSKAWPPEWKPYLLAWKK
ncbi:27496_t:CDS:2, partial [Dentiscutata erythropus]